MINNFENNGFTKVIKKLEAIIKMHTMNKTHNNKISQLIKQDLTIWQGQMSNQPWFCPVN